ncbi:MAG: queuosine precursor transporter [Arachnia sp.]
MSNPSPEPPTAGVAPLQRGHFDLIVALFCALLLLSNISAVKLIQFGPHVELGGFQIFPVITDGGAFLFPLTYVVGDVLAEVYGMRGARRAIGIGFAVSILASLTFLLVGIAPSADGWVHQAAFEAILGFVPHIVAASLAAYVAGQLLNAFVLVKIKQRTREGSLWARLLGSTLVGEAADTVVFAIIAFGGIISGSELLNYVVVGYVYKVTVEALFLPVTYRVIAWVKQHEPAYHAHH